MAADSLLLAMVGPQPLPWERPVGPDLAVPDEQQVHLREIGSGQEEIDKAYSEGPREA